MLRDLNGPHLFDALLVVDKDRAKTDQDVNQETEVDEPVRDNEALGAHELWVKAYADRHGVCVEEGQKHDVEVPLLLPVVTVPANELREVLIALH